MTAVIVYHSYYGCETGCCGHRVELFGDGVDVVEGMGTQQKFEFAHPGIGEDPISFAKDLVEETFGAEHVADLDWERCIIMDD